MVSLLKLAALALAATSAYASVATFTPSHTVARAILPFNPDISVLNPLSVVGGTPQRRSTNAQRFAAGLPPLPRSRQHMRKLPARSTPSGSPPVYKTVVIKASLSDGTFVGYLTPALNEFGEYGAFQPTKTGALQVTYLVDPGPVNLVANNGQSALYPNVGGVVGFASTSDNFAPSSHNYAYIAGVPSSPPGSPPFINGGNSFSDATGIPEDTESAIWYIDATTGALRAQWINTDGSQPATFLVETQGVLSITGDTTAFANTIGTPTSTYILAVENP